MTPLVVASHSCGLTDVAGVVCVGQENPVVAIVDFVLFNSVEGVRAPNDVTSDLMIINNKCFYTTGMSSFCYSLQTHTR